MKLAVPVDPFHLDTDPQFCIVVSLPRGRDLGPTLVLFG